MISILWPVIRSQWFRRIVLQQLMNLTARAFGKPAKRIWTLSCQEALKTYAEYTRDNLAGPPTDELIERMTEEAYQTGHWLRRMFLLRRPEEIDRFLIELYRHIGITLEGHIPGDLCFRRCYFSRYYTPETCRAASALDEGMMRGLAGSGSLRFRQRITEGCENCKAIYK